MHYDSLFPPLQPSGANLITSLVARVPPLTLPPAEFSRFVLRETIARPHNGKVPTQGYGVLWISFISSVCRKRAHRHPHTYLQPLSLETISSLFVVYAYILLHVASTFSFTNRRFAYTRTFAYLRIEKLWCKYWDRNVLQLFAIRDSLL